METTNKQTGIAAITDAKIAVQRYLFEHGGNASYYDLLTVLFAAFKTTYPDEQVQATIAEMLAVGWIEQREKGNYYLVQYKPITEDYKVWRRQVIDACRDYIKFNPVKTVFSEVKIYHVAGFSLYAVFGLYNEAHGVYHRATLDVVMGRVDISSFPVKVK